MSFNQYLTRLRHSLHSGRSRQRSKPLARQVRPRLEVLEDRTLPTVNVLNNYVGLSENGFAPPDSQGAAGLTNFVETQNQDLAIFTPKTTGTTSVGRSFSDFLFTQGGLARASSVSSLSDPIVVWDDKISRFIVGDQDVDIGQTTHNSNFDIAISKSASPATLTTADWFFYSVSTTEANHDADYPGNFGYNADAFVFTMREFGFGGGTTRTLVTAININDLVAGNALVTSGSGQNVFQNDINGIDWRPTVMHDAAPGDPMWLLHTDRGSGNSDDDPNILEVDKMTPVLSTATVFTTTTLTVNNYSTPNVPLNPDGTSIIPGRGATFTGILKAAEFNNNIVASDTTAVGSTQDDVRWYRVDVSSGTPTLADQGDVSAGDKTYLAYGGIDINAEGDIGLVYQQSGNDTTTDYLSMYVTGRLASDPAGTMQTPVLVPSGTGTTNNTDGREGDMTGINVDSTPITATAPSNQSAVEGASQSFSLGSFTDLEGDFWATAEFSSTGGLYQTAIAHFASLSTKGPWSIDVNWGDGTAHGSSSVSTQGSLGTLSHTFGEEGTYTVTVKVTDTADGHSDSKTFQVTVFDPAVLASGVPVSAVEGAAFTASIATFTDPGGSEPNASDPGALANHYKVDSIDWGDGTALDITSGAISFDGVSTFTVAGSHTYGEEGTFTITAVIDHEGILTTVMATATVSDPAVVATPVPVFAVTCLTNKLTLATFTDPGGPEPNPSDPSGTLANHYKVDSIDWGDATPLDTTTGGITFDGVSTFTVTGKHAYMDEGVFTVTVILDHEGVLTTVQTTATIKDDIGLLLLDKTGSKSLMVTGNGVVDVTGCGVVVVDSSDSTAAFVTGNGSVIAEDIDVTGGVKTAGHGSFSVPVEKEPATTDPLGLGLPAAPSPIFAAVNYSGSAALTLNPGTYIGGIKITGNGNVTLNPGVYYMMGGGFSVTGKGSVTGMNVLIVNAPARAGDTTSITGKGDVSLTGLTSGPDQGLVILQDPQSSNTVQFSGQGNVTLTGVVYVPDALVQITGQANVTINPGAGTAVSPPPILGAVIAFDLKVDGNGVLTINPDDPPNMMMSVSSNNPLQGNAAGSGRDASPDTSQMRQVSLVLLGGQPAAARGPSLGATAPSSTFTTAVPNSAASLSFSNFAATSVALAGASAVGHSDDYWISSGFDLSERFWNDLVAG